MSLSVIVCTLMPTVVVVDENMEPVEKLSFFENGEFVGLGGCYIVNNSSVNLRLVGIDNDRDLSEDICFKVVENATGEILSAEETMLLSEAHHGNMANPFELHVITHSTGVADAMVETSFNIYPNPVRQTLYLNGPIEDIISLQVLAANGTVMIAENRYNGGLDVSSLYNGVYVLCIKTEQGLIYKKFMKVS